MCQWPCVGDGDGLGEVGVGDGDPPDGLGVGVGLPWLGDGVGEGEGDRCGPGDGCVLADGTLWPGGCCPAPDGPALAEWDDLVWPVVGDAVGAGGPKRLNGVCGPPARLIPTTARAPSSSTLPPAPSISISRLRWPVVSVNTGTEGPSARAWPGRAPGRGGWLTGVSLGRRGPADGRIGDNARRGIPGRHRVRQPGAVP